MTDRESRYTTLELLCVLFWFLLDGFWLLEWKFATYGFSVAALVAAALMFLYIKRERALILVACADTCWLSLNVLWAIGDLSKVKPALLVAKVLFWVGIGLCVAAFAATDHSRRLSAFVLGRMRIMRYFRRMPDA